MPITYRFTVIRKRYPRALGPALLEAIYSGFTRFNEVAYERILATAPKSKTPSPRWPVGFVSSHIQLVLHRRGRYSYKVVAVPGGTHKGSRAWRAWIALNALHYGWTKLPFERRPTRRKALGLPLVPGMEVPPKGGDKLPRKKAVQKRQITKNPWIERIWNSMLPQFLDYLDREFELQRRKKRKERLASFKIKYV